MKKMSWPMLIDEELGNVRYGGYTKLHHVADQSWRITNRRLQRGCCRYLELTIYSATAKGDKW